MLSPSFQVSLLTEIRNLSKKAFAFCDHEMDRKMRTKWDELFSSIKRTNDNVDQKSH